MYKRRVIRFVHKIVSFAIKDLKEDNSSSFIWRTNVIGLKISSNSYKWYPFQRDAVMGKINSRL